MSQVTGSAVRSAQPAEEQQRQREEADREADARAHLGAIAAGQGDHQLFDQVEVRQRPRRAGREAKARVRRNVGGDHESGEPAQPQRGGAHAREEFETHAIGGAALSKEAR